MKKLIIYYFLLFGIGCFGYGLIEILWRGYTHPSMGIAGGISFCLISIIQKNFSELQLVYRCLLSGLSITVIELIFGIIFNIILNENVWNYSRIPLNFYGQICLLYTVLWCFLSIPLLRLTAIIRNFIIYENKVNPNQNSKNNGR